MKKLASVLFVILFSCVKGMGKKETKGEDIVKGGKKVEISGSVSAESSFAEEGMVTGRMVTGRMVTGRIITARSPSVQQEQRVKVPGAVVMIEELGVSVEADGEGRFSFPVLVSGCPCKFTLSVGAVRKDGKSYRLRQSIEITEEDIGKGRKDLGEITIYATGGITGKVKLKHAEKSSGVYVYVPGTPMVSITDEDGNFIMGDIPAGSYKVVIEKYGYESKATENVQVEPGKITFIGEFELLKTEEKFIRGRVVDEEGKPVVGAFIISDTGKVAISDRYGSFQISADSKTLTVGKEGYDMVVTSVIGEEIEVKLYSENLRLGAIKGKVYNWTTTKPIGGVTVLLLPSGSATTSREDGSFVIPDVPPGDYTIMFIRSDYEIGIEILSVGNGQVVDLGVLGLLPDCPVANFYRDADGDGFGDKKAYVEDCYAPYGYVGNSNDCDDTKVGVHPGAVEICNGVDDNCNGEVDEFVAETFFKDSDGDGFGDPNSLTSACSKPPGYVLNDLDCDDTNKLVNPTSPEICDTVDNNCNGVVNDGVLSNFYIDEDGDGQGYSSDITYACKDSQGVLRDSMGNEITQPYVSNSLDCNDADKNIRFGINETKCDGIDDNCNGIIDDGVLKTFYRDADGDGYGNPNSTTQACSAPQGYVEDNTDCDDNDRNFNPSMTEVVDGQDQNCDGLSDNLSFKIETIDSLSPVHFIDLATDNLGIIHTIFAYTAYGDNKHIAYYTRDTDGWWLHGTKRVDSNLGTVHSPSIDVSPDGLTAYMSYYSGDGGFCGADVICVNAYSGGSWVAGNGEPIDSGTMSEIKFSYQTSTTHLVYVVGATKIVHTYATPSTPNFSPSVSSVVYENSSSRVCDIDVAVSPNGMTVHIVFVLSWGADCSSGSRYPYYTRNLTPYNFNSWLEPKRLTSYEYGVDSVGIAVSSSGVTHVCFTGKNTPHLFYMAVTDSVPQSVDGEGPMSSCSITVDKDGNPHISYISTAFEYLKYATKLEGLWKVFTVVYVESVTDHDGTSIKVDSKKNPHIVFIGHRLPRYATTGN